MFLGLALIFGAAPLGTDMYLPSIPSITRELQTSAASTQLAITTFMVGMGVGQVVFGPISDKFGRRQLLILGTFLGLIASIVCSLAASIEVLVTARLFQGIAGGIGSVLVRAIITDRANRTEAARSFAILMMINGVAPIVAPLLGGVLQEITGWRGVFWALAVIAVVQLAIALRNPESHPSHLRSEGGLLRTYRNMGELLKLPEFVGHLLVFGFGFGALFSFIAGSSVVLQSQLGLTPVHYSIVFAVNACSLICMSVLNVRLSGRVPPRKLQKIGVGLILGGAAALLLVTLVLGSQAAGIDVAAGQRAPLWFIIVVVLCTMTASSGTGLVMSNTTAIAQGLAQRSAGAGSALLGAVQFTVAGVVSPMVALGSNQLLMLALTMSFSALVALAGSTVVAARS